MNTTRVDDMLIEMITPRVQEIESRFGRGEGLSQDDINTLLLKSQYNHINHLDAKLDEITASVVALENRFDKRFVELESRFDKRFVELEGKFQALEGKFEVLEGKFDTFKAEMRTEFQKSQADMRELIITTMRWYIGGAGIVIVLMKALDLFVK